MRLLLPFAATLVIAGAVPADDAPFASVRPILAQHCLKCHSATAGKRKGGLSLDTRANTLHGGDTGPAVVPGKPAESLLIQAVRQTGELKMPPTDKLPADAIAALERWVEREPPA